MEKEYLYIGHYYSNGVYVLKVGTTNNLERRNVEHNRNYHRTPNYPMAEADSFTYDFTLPLSKYNTLRYEDKIREKLKAENVGDYIRNDRFACHTKPQSIQFTIRKLYTISL